jgi:hypothetical protein
MSRNLPLPPDRRIVHIQLPVSLINWCDDMAREANPKLDRGRVITALLSDARAQGARITGYTIDVECTVSRKETSE